MPRISRQYNATTKLYHAIIKGIDGQDIFWEDKDKNKFLKGLVLTKEKYRYDLCAYCLMDNHVHLNPIHANLKEGKYDEWNSLKEYETQEKTIREDILLSTFDTDKQKAKQKLKKFQEERKKNTISDKIEFEMISQLTDLEAKEYLQEISGMQEIHQIKELDKEEKKKMIKKLCQESNLSIVQMARVIGINRKIIERIKKCPKQKCP